MWPRQPRCSQLAYSSFYWQQHQLVFGRYLFGCAGGLANPTRAVSIQHLAAQIAQDPDFRWKEADRLLVATFQPSLKAKLQRRWIMSNAVKCLSVCQQGLHCSLPHLAVVLGDGPSVCQTIMCAFVHASVCPVLRAFCLACLSSTHKPCVRVPSQARAAPAKEVCSDVVRAIGRCFPFVQREREVRAFVEDLCELHGYHQQNRGEDIESPPPAGNFSAE